MKLNIVPVVSDPFGENSFLVWKEGDERAIVVDPGFEPDQIIADITKRKLQLVAILITHGHVDHIAGNRAMKAFAPEAALVIGKGDAPKLGDPMLNLSGVYGFDIQSPPADREVVDGELIEYAGISFRVREIPGHSIGHVVFVVDESEPVHVFGGDVLFAGSVGRTDFPGGSFELLAKGIHEKLWILPDSAQVHPGHGPSTTIGEEKRTNPFVGL